MFVEITNEPRDYDWGSATAIPGLLGRPITGRPQAELWLGTHPGSPAQLVGRAGTLADVAAPLPFLLKVLAARTPLSIQAHPDAAQATAGFARENALGIPLDSPQRNYRDASPKPELLYVLEDGFRALCGFRPVEETQAVLSEVDDPRIAAFRNRLTGPGDLGTVVAWLLSGERVVQELVTALVASAADRAGATWAAIRHIAATRPGDPGIAVATLLNVAEFRAGEAVFLAAGVPHAYLEGVGIELMTASDNVLRGALTSKHVDVAELLAVLDVTPAPAPILPPEDLAPGIRMFRPPVPGFQLVAVAASAFAGGPVVLAPDGPALVLCTTGWVGVERGPRLRRGAALYVEGEGPLGLDGEGEIFLAARSWDVIDS